MVNVLLIVHVLVYAKRLTIKTELGNDLLCLLKVAILNKFLQWVLIEAVGLRFPIVACFDRIRTRLSNLLAWLLVFLLFLFWNFTRLLLEFEVYLLRFLVLIFFLLFLGLLQQAFQ